MPSELSVMARMHDKREKQEWARRAWFTAYIMNASIAPHSKRRVNIQPKELMPKFCVEADEFDEEKRRTEALETARIHKEKAWMKIRGATSDKVQFFGDNEEQVKALEERTKGKEPLVGDMAKLNRFINREE